MVNDILNALIVTVQGKDGSVIELPSDYQLKAEHDNGICGAWCGYCITEAENAEK